MNLIATASGNPVLAILVEALHLTSAPEQLERPVAWTGSRR